MTLINNGYNNNIYKYNDNDDSVEQEVIRCEEKK